MRDIVIGIFIIKIPITIRIAFEQTHESNPKKDELRAAYISVYRMINHLKRLKKTKRFALLRNLVRFTNNSANGS